MQEPQRLLVSRIEILLIFLPIAAALSRARVSISRFASALQPFMDAARQVLFVTGDMDLALLAPDDAARGRAMADAMVLAEEGNDGAMAEWNRLRQLVETLGDPILVA